MNISDTFFFTSSAEAPKLQGLPGTFVPSTEKTLMAQKLFARFKQGNFDMSDTPGSGRPCFASGGIWKGVSFMNYLRGTSLSLLNAFANNFAVWRKQSSKNARVDDME
jgi:hypothetical protein